jgi:hypothetical protein
MTDLPYEDINGCTSMEALYHVKLADGAEEYHCNICLKSLLTEIPDQILEVELSGSDINLPPAPIKILTTVTCSKCPGEGCVMKVHDTRETEAELADELDPECWDFYCFTSGVALSPYYIKVTVEKVQD